MSLNHREGKVLCSLDLVRGKRLICRVNAGQRIRCGYGRRQMIQRYCCGELPLEHTHTFTWRDFHMGSAQQSEESEAVARTEMFSSKQTVKGLICRTAL